ncbi:MAG: cation transporter [Steroidobacteraceae bacterium]
MPDTTASQAAAAVDVGAPLIGTTTLSRYRKVYLMAWLLSLLVVLIELTGAMVSGSFALRADVWHVAGDMLIAIAPVVVSYTRARRVNVERIVLSVGVVVAATLIAIGCAVLAEARSALLVGTPSHEVHGWVLSGFSLMSGAVNLLQTRMLSLIHASHRDMTHVGFHFHVRMDLLKNLALPTLGALLALHLAPQQSDTWAAGCIGAWIATRGLALLARSAVAFRHRALRLH